MNLPFEGLIRVNGCLSGCVKVLRIGQVALLILKVEVWVEEILVTFPQPVPIKPFKKVLLP